MRTQLLAFITSIVTIASATSAQVSLEMEPLEANSSITDITLYRGRAAITRRATLDLDAGGYSIFFRDLPSSAYLDSVQASVSENAKLLSIDTSSTPIAKDNSKLLKEILAELKDSKTQLHNAEAQAESIKVQKALLKTLIDHASNDKKENVDLAVLQEQLEFIGSNMTSLSVAQIENANTQSELQQHIEMLQRKINNLGNTSKTQRNAVVDIGVATAGTITIELTYLVNNATWNPTYSIRANNKADLITIEYDADIQQKSGENWTDVTMTLSTAQPQQSATPPMPTPWFVDVYKAPPAPTANPSRRSAGVYSGKGVEAESMMDQVAMASANATINSDGPAVSFTLPRKITVTSNAQDMQTTSLGAFETEAKLFRIAVPMITDSTYIRSNVTNTSDYILLPGVASIFHGSDYVGKTSLPTIAPGESFDLDLGIDPIVIASRVLLEKETVSTGLFSSGIQTLYKYRVTISNGHEETIEVQLWDRMPVSRNEEIEVTLKNISTPLSTDALYLSSLRPTGLLRWDLQLLGNTTGKSSTELSWEVDVARSNNIEMTPLPE
ncbi:MAG: hypothetical protein ACI9JK_000358 [Phycisphaerales bacterium]|jgi:uncharacterized protein (TIGR02231 family)